METETTQTPKGILFLAFLAWAAHLVLLVGGLITSYVLAGSEQVPDLALFMGRFHPMVLHFPVGLLATLFLLELLGKFKPSEGLSLASYVLLAIGTHTAVVAAVMGLFLASGGGYDEETLFWHKWLGFGVAAFAVLAAGSKIAELKGSSSMKMGYFATLILANLFLVFGGHEGANLTHGKTYLFKYAPDFVANAFGYGKEQKKPVSASSSEDVFTTKVLPILEEKCFKCHGEEKQKGDYRLDNYKGLMTAGESEVEPIEPYVPAASYLVELITLAGDDDLVMPPEGKGEMTDAEIMTIIRWIANGAKGPSS